MKKYSIWLNENEIACNLHSMEEAEELVERYRKSQYILFGYKNLDFHIEETKYDES